MNSPYGYDFTLKAGANAKTTTAQYKCFVVSDEFTGNVVTSTATARTAKGIIQSYESSSSECITVRTTGISRAVCGGSITAGQWICAYEGVSTTTHYGSIQGIVEGASIAAYGATVSAFRTVLGYALENGQTNQVISVMLIPQLYDLKLIGET